MLVSNFMNTSISTAVAVVIFTPILNLAISIFYYDYIPERILQRVGTC